MNTSFNGGASQLEEAAPAGYPSRKRTCIRGARELFQHSNRAAREIPCFENEEATRAATTAAAGARFCFQRDNQTLAARCERKHTLLIPRSAEHAHLVRTLPRELERAHVAPSVEEPKALRAVHVGKERD